MDSRQGAKPEPSSALPPPCWGTRIEETSELPLTYQQVHSVQIGLLEQVLELQLGLCGFRGLAAGAGPLLQHLVQVEKGQLRVVLFLLRDTAIQADGVYRQEAGAPPAHGSSQDQDGTTTTTEASQGRVSGQLTEHTHSMENI